MKKLIDHREYEEELQKVRSKSRKSQDEIAEEHVPKLYSMLKKAGYEIEDARNKTVRDLRKDPGWAEDTIMHWMPDEAKDSVKQDNGRKGGEEAARRRRDKEKYTFLTTYENLIEMREKSLESEDRDVYEKRNADLELLYVVPRTPIKEKLKRKVSEPATSKSEEEIAAQ